MKARFLALAALVLGLASCQNDFDGANVGAGGEVDFQLSVAAPELATRAGTDGVTPDGQADLNSAYGAIDYLQANDEGDAALRTDWSDVNLRYTLEVYDKADSYAADVAPIKDRQVIIVDEYQPVTFELRLVPKRDYHFVVFADFVPQDVTDATQTSAIEAQRNIGLHHVIGNTLADITIKEDGINDECSDAYFATKDIVISNSAAQDIVLKRPYGKLRVIATDLHELNLNVNPAAVKVEYTAAHVAKFNAITGAIDTDTVYETATYDSEYNAIYKEADKGGLANHFYTTGYDALEGHKYTNANDDVRHTHMTLFTDYILASDSQHTVQFTMTVYDKYDAATQDGRAIKTTTFNTDIPVQRNYLTTVIGNVLTTATEIEVRIDDNFAGEYTEDLWDGSIKAPAYDAETKTYSIYEASELAWVAAVVNGEITRSAAQRNFAGETVKLMNNIGLDLNGDRWTPIGAHSTIKEGTCFKGTFDGNGKIISNLFVSTEGNASAGLFANCMGTIKNLTVKDAVIYGHYKAGVIVADGTCAKLENCHVDGAKIVVTPYEKDNANHVGGIVGYLVADGGAAYAKNCSAKNVEISAFRDVAGVVGTASGAVVVTGNSVENATITADQTAEYVKETYDGNAGAIVGRYVSTTNATIDQNTVGEGVEVIRKVNSTEEFTNALADRRNEDVIYVGEGEVVLPYSLVASGINTLTIEGIDANAAVQFNKTPGGADGGLNCYADGMDLVFRTIKVISPNTGSAYTGGFGRANSVLFDKCVYEGQYRSLSYVEFNTCTIDPKTSYIYTDYSDADFINCKFNCSEGKGIQVYNDGNVTETTINVVDCTFVAEKHGQTWDKKPVTAIDINSNGEKFTVNINNSTATGFPEGEYTGETMFNIKGGAEYVEIYIDGNKWISKGIITDNEGNLVVNSLDTLEAALKSAGAAGAGDTTIVFAENSTLDMTGTEWTPINVDGYNGADIVTIDGKGSVIKGLTSALFAGGFAGGSGIIIKNLTIEDSAIVASNTQGYGAFVNNADSMDVITLDNCHLKNSSIITPNDGADESRIGGLIGWTSGYNVTSDGPVDSFITVKNCSVVGCTLKGFGSIGAICGHAGANPATYTTIENCTIQNNKLISTDDGGWRVGVVVGTANVGEVYINNITASGNTLEQTGKTAPTGDVRRLYGRAVLGTTGKLVIDGYTYVADGQFVDPNGNAVVGNNDAFKAAMEAAQEGDTIVICDNTTIDLTKVSIKDGIIIEGGKNAAISLLNSNSYITTKTNATFKNIKFLIKGDGEYYSRGIENGGYSHTYINCEFTGIATNFGKNTYIECTFTNDVKGKYAAWVYAGTATYTKCTFNAVDRAAKVYTEDNGTATVVYTDCKFNAQEVNKSAVEIDASLANVNYNVTITNATISNMGDADTWGNKYFNIEGTGAVVNHDGTIWDPKNK